MIIQETRGGITKSRGRRRHTLADPRASAKIGRARTYHLRLTPVEASWLDMFLRQAHEAIHNDTRPDHGLARLRSNWKHEAFKEGILRIMGRIGRWTRKG